MLNAMTGDPSKLKTLQKSFGLCQAVTAENAAISYASLLQYLVLTYQSAAQMNFAAPSKGRTPIAYPLKEVIKIALEAKDSVQVLNNTAWLWFGPKGPDLPCLDVSTKGSTIAVAKVVTEVESNVWQYAICESFPRRVETLSRLRNLQVFTFLRAWSPTDRKEQSSRLRMAVFSSLIPAKSNSASRFRLNRNCAPSIDIQMRIYATLLASSGRRAITISPLALHRINPALTRRSQAQIATSLVLWTLTIMVIVRIYLLLFRVTNMRW